MVLALPALAAAVAVVLEALLMAILIALIICAILYLLYVVIKYIAEWVSTTAPPMTPTWDDAIPVPSPPVAIPQEEVEPVPIPVPIPIEIPDTKTKPKEKNRDKNIWNVYDLHFNVPAQGRYYNRGEGYEPRPRMYKVGDIYKYGITSFKTVYLRYLIIQEIFPTDKGEYILNQLKDAILAPHQWYLANVTRNKANQKEVQLIDTYVSKHGELPPGNTFRG